MEFIVKKTQILDILSKMQGLTGRKSNLAITENVLIQAKEGEICLIATDLESGFEGYYSAEVKKEGSIAINARKFFEIVRDFPKEDIHVNEVENRWIEIGNKNVFYHIVGVGPEDFPDTPQLNDAKLSELPASEFKSMIEKTAMIAGAPNDKRAHINGIYFERRQKDDQNIIRMVSTDGSRLSLVDTVFKDDFGLDKGSGVLIPKKGLNEVNKFLEPEGEVSLGIKDNKFIIKKGRETLIVRLLEGEFPKYEEIVVKHEGRDLVLERKEFFMMLKRMSILSSDTYRAAIFTFDENNLMVSATNPDIGESKEEMEIDFKDSKIEAAFNPRYFIDILNVMSGEKVILNILDGEKPCLLEDEKNKNFISVIMPMKI